MPVPGARLEWKEEIGYTGFGCSHCAWTDPNPSFERGRPAIAEAILPEQARAARAARVRAACLRQLSPLAYLVVVRNA